MNNGNNFLIEQNSDHASLKSWYRSVSLYVESLNYLFKVSQASVIYQSLFLTKIFSLLS